MPLAPKTRSSCPALTCFQLLVQESGKRPLVPSQGTEGPGMSPQGVPGRPGLSDPVPLHTDGRWLSLPWSRLCPSQAARPGEPGCLFRLESEGGAGEQALPRAAPGAQAARASALPGAAGAGERGSPRRNPRRRQLGSGLHGLKGPPCPGLSCLPPQIPAPPSAQSGRSSRRVGSTSEKPPR